MIRSVSATSSSFALEPTLNLRVEGSIPSRITSSTCATGRPARLRRSRAAPWPSRPSIRCCGRCSNWARETEITRRSATAAMETHFKLSEAERQARIPSGVATFVRHRVGWAMTDLKFAGLIEKVRPKTYRATPAATPFLAGVPGPISIKDLESLPPSASGRAASGRRTRRRPRSRCPRP